ncbi:hypothetical protein P20429_3531 [Pseudoalteromonas sp. BSi20429]|nr:hypothetical protein P20429_3531 [Pseudoalteromonas sp. BSi20429]
MLVIFCKINYLKRHIKNIHSTLNKYLSHYFNSKNFRPIKILKV